MEQNINYNELLKSAFVEIKRLKKKINQLESNTADIAIVGIGCRFPGNVDSPETFWQKLMSNFDAIEKIPASRWDNHLFYDQDYHKKGKINCNEGGFISGIDKFDALFFGISPREAEFIDPQHRILLEVCWEAFENAGILIDKTNDKNNTGVYIGVTTNDYFNEIIEKGHYKDLVSFHGTGNAHNAAAGRVSFTFGFRGPCITSDTACSSSLVSVHQACQALLNRDCNVALAGGVNIISNPINSIITSHSQMLSPESRCKAFDNHANGYVRSEGCGIVVLKRLDQAIADNDTVYAVIKGTGVNHNGYGSALSVPNVDAQARLISRVIKKAGVAPADIDYIEAHGTGTGLGDPIEIKALSKVFATSHTKGNPLLIGTVKTNIGHAESSAGVAGLIKVALSAKNKVLPANLHFNEPSKNIDWENLPVKIVTENTSWEKAFTAGISSFGVSGTNAHVIIKNFEENNTLKTPANRPIHVFTLSAKSEKALTEYKTKYKKFLQENSGIDIAELCVNVNNYRNHFETRFATVVGSKQDLLDKLAVEADSMPTPSHPDKTKIAFLFTGQGSQYPEMAKELYQNISTFRKHLVDCDNITRKNFNFSVIDLIYNASDNQINNTEFTQPALFCLEFSLARFLQDLGIEPTIVAGHSLGEFVAACIANVFTPIDAIKIIVHRASLMSKAEGKGSMFSVGINEQKVRSYLHNKTDVAIAAINGPESIVISGAEDTVNEIVAQLQKDGIQTKKLAVSHAFHSPLMNSIKHQFREVLNSVSMKIPTRKIISNLTGELAGDQIATSDYWINHLINPIQFYKSIVTLGNTPLNCIIEIGPQPVLTSLAKTFCNNSSMVWLTSMRNQSNELKQFFTTIAELYTRGFNVNWSMLNEGYFSKKINLPTYPFQRESFWISKKTVMNRNQDTHPFLMSKTIVAGYNNLLVYEGIVDSKHPAFLKDHIINESALLPASAFIDMALSSITNGKVSEAVCLKNISFIKPIEVNSHSNIKIQLVHNQAKFEIFSDEDSNGDYVKSAEGTFETTPSIPKANINFLPDMSEVKITYTFTDFYHFLKTKGYNYGESFRGVTQIEATETTAFGSISLPNEIVFENEYHAIHPALLDSCMQTAAIFLPQAGNDLIFVPVFVEGFYYYSKPGSTAKCKTQITDPIQKDSVTLNFLITDNTGEVFVEIQKLTFRAINSKLSDNTSGLERLLYNIDWEEINDLNPRHDDGSYLVFVNQTDVENDLVHFFQSKGISVVFVKPSDRFWKADHNIFSVDPSNPDNYTEMLRSFESEKINRILHFWTLQEPGQFSDETITASLNFGATSVLNIIKSFHGLKTNHFPELTIITNIIPGFKGKSEENIIFSDLWGLINVIKTEHPEFKTKIIGCSPNAINIGQIIDIAANFLYDKVVLNQGKIYHPFLTRFRNVNGACNLEAPYELSITEPGVLKNLKMIEKCQCAPADGEVSIKVKATGLNFKEVLYALGTLKIDKIGGRDFQFGFECSGEIISVGINVTGFKPGDEVIAMMAPGCMGSHINAASEFVFHKPPKLSWAEAASLPIVFTTAYYALVTLAKIKPSDKVLIHAAAGGVGNAAIQIARQFNAHIFATASEPKHEYLQSMNVEHVMNSRDTSFKDYTLQITEGKGVDIIISSFSGELMYKTLDTCKQGGTFVEIGKVAASDVEKIKLLRPDITYYNFDLGEIAYETPALVNQLFLKILEGFINETLKPLPVKTFSIFESEQAFRFLAQGKNIGKVVIIHPEENQKQELFNPESWYVITGGTGGLGLVLTEWLINNKAKNIVLISRTGKSAKITTQLELLAQAGANIEVYSADVSDYESISAVFNLLKREGKKVKGIFHAAGVVHDSLLLSLSVGQFEAIMKPKAIGTWNLHLLSLDMQPDYFVTFSSLSSIIGNPGQGNYASANAFMDGIMHYRHSLNLPALTINWGPFEQAGMAKELDMATLGLVKLIPLKSFDVLKSLLGQDITQVGVFNVNWNAFSNNYPIMNIDPFFESFKQNQNRKEKNDILKNISTPNGKNKLLEFISNQIKITLGISGTTEIDINKSLFEYGLDSLMVVELKNKMEREFNIQLSSTLFFNYPSIETLTNYIFDLILPGKQAKIGTIDEQNEFENFSIEEISQLIDDELKEL